MVQQKMFREGEARYMTIGISERLPPLYQILLWNIIDKLRDGGQALDYLQVFEVKTTDNPDRKGRLLLIKHSQEKPAYRKEYTLPVRSDTREVNGKIYVIDDIDHATMLWADEY